MASLNTATEWVTFLESLISAIQDGSVAVDSLKGKTLPEMAAISEQGWDKFDQAIADAEKEKGPGA
jgi:hypothetical protein